MFFIFGAASKQEQLDFNQPAVCTQCGRYGNYTVIMEYMYFSLFFIPLIKWHKQYYVKSSCCNSVYTITQELGGRIASGGSTTLTEQDLQLVRDGSRETQKCCAKCGYQTTEDFKYCPKCASPLA
ncbi:MAG TPA: zinc ribbon domain-containing protein [Oscillospiraceae bacterium]|nr:zinc ribbon domain-containing protein [Oscillospiraceae bacterium]